MNGLFLACAMCAFSLWPSAAAMADTPLSSVPVVVAKPGIPKEIYSRKCIQLVATPQLGATGVPRAADGESKLVYTPTPEQRDQVVIDAIVGDTAADEGGKCAGGVTMRFPVSIDSQPEVPKEGLDTAFRTLMIAFVLALLLESAFELVFNWRLFQEFFVGKAWRTPIMFVVSYIVVSHFNFDLLSSVLNAYQGTGRQSFPTSTLNYVVTAMIIAGGSVGVNRILIGLSFRSARPKIEEEQPKPGAKEAYISVAVLGQKIGSLYEIGITEVEPAPEQSKLAVLHGRERGRLRDLFSPNLYRAPRSGGYRVSTEKGYRITVTDPKQNAIYDVTGKKLESIGSATPLRFAPGAIVDFVVNVAQQDTET